MKVEKIVVDPRINILDMTENEFLMLKALINNTGFEREDRVKEEVNLWEDAMTEEEALETAERVAKTIWGLRSHSCKESAKK